MVHYNTVITIKLIIFLCFLIIFCEIKHSYARLGLLFPFRADGGIPTGGSAAFQAGYGTKAPPELSKLLRSLSSVRIPPSTNEKETPFRCLFPFRADGGIRTLVTRRSNAFRVRPVMTASIRLLVSEPGTLAGARHLLFSFMSVTTFLFYQTCSLSCNS